MTIGVDIRPLMDEFYSGVSEYTLNLLMEIFNQDTKNQYRLFYNSYHDISSRLPVFNFPNVRIIKLNYPNKIFNYILLKIFKWPKIDKILGGVDVYFLPNLNFIALSRSCRSIVTVHDLSFIRYPHYFSARHNFWQKNINIKKLLRTANTVITVSNHTKHDVQELCGIPWKKTATVYSGISDNFQPREKSDSRLLEVKAKYKLPEKFMLFLGTLEPRKNIEAVIEAYEIFRQNQKAELIQFSGTAEVKSDILKLVIAGRGGWGHTGIYERARKSLYRDDIIFTGYIVAADKPALYNLAEFLVYPSLYEGFGFPPLEAAACGIPSIVSNCSSLPEIMGNAAILVDPFNTSEIAHAMANLAYDKNLRSDLSCAALERAKRFSWEKCAREMINIFEESGK